MNPPATTTKKELGFATRAIHVGSEPDVLTGAVSPPVYQTSTYAQEEVGKHKGYEYARTHNPTRERLERNVADLEGGAHGLAFASGLAAINTLLQTLRSGDHVVASNDMYGGTYRLFEKVLTGFGLQFTYVDATREKDVEAAFRPETRMLFLETPTNPLMKITDLDRMAQLARARGAFSVVDNTFSSPYLQRPLEFGIDVALHSTTKYLNGHSDVVGGILVTSHAELAERLRFLQNAAGAVPGPWDCWLALRGTKTLALRMARHDASARELAAWLDRQPAVRHVYYPGLPAHPQHELAKRQMRGFGGIVSLEMASFEAAKRLLAGLRVFVLAESLGGVESIATHPASMTHAAVPREVREANGFTDGLVRLSVGCEEVEDLRRDLDQALARL